MWKRRNVTWLGKITIIKTLCLSKINFAISSIEMPIWFKEEIKTLFEDYL